MKPESQVESKLTRSDFLPLLGFALGLLPTLLTVIALEITKPCHTDMSLLSIFGYATIAVFCIDVPLGCVALFRKPLRKFGLSLLITLLLTCSLFLLCIFSGSFIAVFGMCFRFT